MIEFRKETLENGLTVLMHKDETTQLVAINTLYRVGARDEHPEKTGFAHLFEHLMFSGSANIPDFDTPLQRAGGQNNAFTNNDFTNYYITIPKENLETAFWLESDRMLNLGFSEEALEVQRKVVVEEFRQRYLNQPYGELWLRLRPMVYKEHPYQWATIGKKPEHIDLATMADVKHFYGEYYHPGNAILVLAGDLEFEPTMELVRKWYGDIPGRKTAVRTYPVEPFRKEGERLTLKRKVPQDALYLSWLMCDRLHEDYYAYDLLSDILSNGNSSRFYRSLVKERELFTRLSAFITGSMDRGMFVVSGMPAKGLGFDQAKQAILDEFQTLINEGLKEKELEKVKNKVFAQKAYADSGLLAKAMNLAYYEFLGNAHWINDFEENYNLVTEERLLSICKDMIDNTALFEVNYLSANG